jgi:single-stranded-DNA-specific exonuclease
VVGVYCDLRLDAISSGLVDELAGLAPHGEGNPEPILIAADVEVIGEPRVLGRDGRHVSFFVRDGGPTFRAVAFGQGDWYGRLREGPRRVSILFRPRWNSWRGERSIELDVRAIRWAGGRPANAPAPSAAAGGGRGARCDATP